MRSAKTERASLTGKYYLVFPLLAIRNSISLREENKS